MSFTETFFGKLIFALWSMVSQLICSWVSLCVHLCMCIVGQGTTVLPLQRSHGAVTLLLLQGSSKVKTSSLLLHFVFLASLCPSTLLGHHGLCCSAAEPPYGVLQCCKVSRSSLHCWRCSYFSGKSDFSTQGVATYTAWVIRVEWALGSPVMNILSVIALLYNEYTKNRKDWQEKKKTFSLLNEGQ